MVRVDDETLSLYLEVALSGAAPSLLDGLTASDRHRRHMAIGEVARHLVERLRCFDIHCDNGMSAFHHPTLFPQDLGPIG